MKDGLLQVSLSFLSVMGKPLETHEPGEPAYKATVKFYKWLAREGLILPVARMWLTVSQLGPHLSNAIERKLHEAMSFNTSCIFAMRCCLTCSTWSSSQCQVCNPQSCFLAFCHTIDGTSSFSCLSEFTTLEIALSGPAELVMMPGRLQETVYLSALYCFHCTSFLPRSSVVCTDSSKEFLEPV
jgi:hypothetical protein